MRQFAVGLCLLCSTAVHAADQLPPPLKPVPPALYDWSGIYIGTHFGYGWGRTEGTVNLFPFETIKQNLAGGIAGAQIGINLQTGRAVLGVELAGSWSNLNGSSSCMTLSVFSVATTTACDIKQEWSAQLVARFGYAPGDGRFLPYILGGIALAQLEPSLESIGGIPPLGSGVGSVSASWGSSKLHQGSLLGAGLKYAWSPWLSVGLEYVYTIYDVQDHGSNSSITSIFNFAGVFVVTSSGFVASPMNLTTSTLRVVMNYKIE